MEEDCLVVAFLRAKQADTLLSHSCAPTVPAAEADETRQTVQSVLLPQCVLPLSRRKAAGTLLPGSCRAAEEAWWRAYNERLLIREGHSVAFARDGARAIAALVGFEAYTSAATIALGLLSFVELFNMSREMQLSHAAFVASALELMARRHGLSFAVSKDRPSVCSSSEYSLAQTVLELFLWITRTQGCFLDREAVSLIAAAWRRVQRSGAVGARLLDQSRDHPGGSVGEHIAAATAEAAVRGLRECALAGCAAKEVHVSQFKRCGACRTVAYCCREHQLADWPAHKAACKAARKKNRQPA